MTKNKESTRFASQTQETRVAKKLGAIITPNSGAGKFQKSDLVVKDASLSIECKTCMKPQTSFSIKQEWFDKHSDEAFSNRLDNSMIAFNFDYSDKKDYYIIDDKLAIFLVEKLIEQNQIS